MLENAQDGYLGTVVDDAGEGCGDIDCDGSSCPPLGAVGSDHNPWVVIKWTVDGANTLRDVATGLRQAADEYEAMAADGWELVEPIDGGHGCTVWRGEGEPPACGIADCPDHRTA